MNNYKLLPALISILQTRNLTESARELNLTQSAISKTLTQIRIAFHDQIVIRDSNQFILTAKGEALKKQLPLLIQTLDNLYLPSVIEPSQCQRKFTFASSDYVAQAILPSICSELNTEAPNASIEYQLWHKDKLPELASMQLDLVSTITELVPENLHGKSLGEDHLVVMCRPEHPLWQADSLSTQLTIDDYINAQHILISGGGDKDSPIDLALSALDQQRTLFASVPFFQSAIELLLTTNTLLTTPLHIASDFAQKNDLRIMPLPFPLKPQQYYLLWHAKHQQDPEHIWFREICYPLLKNHLQRTKQLGMKLIHTNK